MVVVLDTGVLFDIVLKNSGHLGKRFIRLFFGALNELSYEPSDITNS